MPVEKLFRDLEPIQLNFLGLKFSTTNELLISTNLVVAVCDFLNSFRKFQNYT